MTNKAEREHPLRVLVTGAARGIGAAIAAYYRVQGCAVLTPSRADLDLASPESVQTYVGATAFEIDVLVNNAGENKIGSLDQLALQDWERMITVNLTSPMLLLRAAAASMRSRGLGGWIINIGSCYGLVGRVGRGPYAASKAGLSGLTRIAALEYAADGILINALCPGFVDTDLTRQNNSPQQIADLCGQVPLGRLARPEEIARYVYFLGSEANTYITGQTTVIDGGFVCQ